MMMISHLCFITFNALFEALLTLLFHGRCSFSFCLLDRQSPLA